MSYIKKSSIELPSQIFLLCVTWQEPGTGGGIYEVCLAPSDWLYLLFYFMLVINDMKIGSCVSSCIYNVCVNQTTEIVMLYCLTT